MKYIEKQRQKAIEIRDEFFKDPGQGIFMGKEREFVLSDPKTNLWKGIGEDAMDYFKRNCIGWWKSTDEPTGHLLSSQIACVNHLYPIRQRQDLADSILKQIDPNFKRALVVDDGFVEFEKVGQQVLGKERALTRGANSTSIDALMLGEKNDGQKILILIEWKYTEHYSNNSLLISKSGTSRLDNYKDLLEADNCPIQYDNFEDLFYEPFYQLMRQTLLGLTMTKRKEYDTVDWLHLHIIPTENKELKNNVTSPRLTGDTMEIAWKNVLRQPDKYKVIDPKDFLNPIRQCTDTNSIMTYLENRYWKK